MLYLLNSIGLAFDIVGVVLLYFFALPAAIDRAGGESVAYPSDKTRKRARLYNGLGLTGLVLLVIGFFLQFASNAIQLPLGF